MIALDSLYYKYGSRITSGVSEMFYDRVYEDPSLSPFFKGVEIHGMREHLADVLSVITGGPDLYGGRNIRIAHAAHGITNENFDSFIDHLIASIEEVGATKEEALAIAQVMQERRKEIVTR